MWAEEWARASKAPYAATLLREVSATLKERWAMGYPRWQNHTENNGPQQQLVGRRLQPGAGRQKFPQRTPQVKAAATAAAAGARAEEKFLQFSLDVLEPSYNCINRERIGGGARHISVHDGGKFVCGIDHLRPGCLVYNVGSNNKIEFEAAIRELTPCEVHTFDPTLTKPYVGSHLSAFHNVGLRGTEQAKAQARTAGTIELQTLEEMVASLGHVGRRIEILKVDCEGCEWSAMKAVFEAIRASRLSVGQLLIELHIRYRPNGPGTKYAQVDPFEVLDWAADADAAGLRLFSKERNGWGCRGWICAEFSFVDELQACREFVGTLCRSPAVAVDIVCGGNGRVH